MEPSTPTLAKDLLRIHKVITRGLDIESGQRQSISTVRVFTTTGIAWLFQLYPLPVLRFGFSPHQ